MKRYEQREGRDQVCAPPQLVGVMPLLDSRVLLWWCCCCWQNGYFAFHKYFYDKSCYRHTFKIHRLQLENSSCCTRDINCSKLNCVAHGIKVLVLIFKRTLRSNKLLSKSFSPSEPERSLLTRSQCPKTFICLTRFGPIHGYCIPGL